MIVRFNSRGKGGGSGPADYLMGKDRKRSGARVLRGKLEQTKQVIDSLNFARNYTSGCLSFAEDNIPEHQKNQLMDSFESTIFKGLDRDQYEITWIEHTDKNRLELNYLIANVDLQSGKRYQPYYDKSDRPLIDSWQTIMNGHFDYADPNAPERAAALTHSRDLPRDKLEATKAITNGLLAMIDSGSITSRKDVLSALKEHGFDIIRESEKFISVNSPAGGKSIRLKGEIYERNFKYGQGVRGSIEERSREYKEDRQQRVQQAKSIYQSASKRKLESNAKRYSKRAESTVKSVQENKSSRSFAVDGVEFYSGNVRPEHDNRATEQDVKHRRILELEGNHDRIRTTVNAITRTATERLRASIQRTEQHVEQLREQWRSSANQAYSAKFERARTRQDLLGM